MVLDQNKCLKFLKCRINMINKLLKLENGGKKFN